MEALKIVDFEEKELEEEVEEAWEIKDLGGADWCFRKIKKIEKDFEEQNAYVLNRIEKLKNQLKQYEEYIQKEKEQAENQKTFFKRKLEEYVIENLKDDPKFKLKTAEGKASYGKVRQKWNYNDDTLLQQLKDNNILEFIKTKESINKTELKKACIVTEDGTVVTQDGEILEGIQVEFVRAFNISY